MIFTQCSNLLLLLSEKYHLWEGTQNANVDLRNSHGRYWSVISCAPNTAVAAAREGQRDKEWCSEHLLKDSSPVTDKISASLLLDLISNYCEKAHLWSYFRLTFNARSATCSRAELTYREYQRKEQEFPCLCWQSRKAQPLKAVQPLLLRGCGTTRLLTVQVQSNACWYYGILKRVLYTPHEAQCLLQMHDVPHCGRLRTWNTDHKRLSQTAKQFLTHPENLLRLKGHIYLYIKDFYEKGKWK